MLNGFKTLHFPSIFLISGLILFTQNTAAQFVDRAPELGLAIENPNAEYSSGTSFIDFDGDGWDDISMMTFEKARFWRNTGEGSFEEIDLGVFNDISTDLNMVLWVDYDNDGDKDLFVSAEADGIYLFRNEGDLVLTDVTASVGLEVENTANYGASWGDVNNDGRLDLYLCRYHLFFQTGYQYENRLFLQLEDGSFEDVTNDAGVSDGSKPSFQSLFWDYDEDGWQDIFVINDLMAASNTLYRNNGDGTFTDVTEATGFLANFNAMSVTLGDYDNDEDFDLFISNGTAGNHLYQNNNDGTFSNVALEAGVIAYSNCWGGVWIDHNNDTHQDLYVASAPLNTTLNTINFFYENLGDGTFANRTSELGMGSDTDNLYAVCQGDFNKDGKEDLLISPGNSTAKLYVNENTADQSNHWMSASFEGTYSNRDAIGTRFKVYCDGDVYSRYHLCGEGFISQHSANKHVGLGSHDLIDSLVITWPRGILETHYNLSVDQFYHFVEGETFAPEPWPAVETISACSSGSVLLEIEQGEFSSILWSNGVEEFSQQVNEAGFYSATLTHPNGLSFQTDTLIFTINQPAEVTFEITPPSCFGANDGSISLNASTVEVSAINWINFGVSLELNELSAGMYFYDGTDINGCVFGGDITLVNPAEINVELTQTDLSCFETNDGELSLTISPEEDIVSIEWSNLEQGSSINNLEAGSYEYVITSVTNCVIEGEATVNQPELLEGTITAESDQGICETAAWDIGYELTGGTPPYTLTWTLNIPGEDEMVLIDEPGIPCFPSGTIELLISDENGCELLLQEELESLVGIDNASKHNFKLYPNPGDGLFRIDLPPSNQEVNVFNSLGMKVYTTFHTSSSLDLRFLSPGIYTIQFTDSERIMDSKIIIQ